MKILVIVILLLIVGSLGSGLFFLVNDRSDDSRRVVRALTVRISLSVALFVLLLIAYYAGLIKPHGVMP